MTGGRCALLAGPLTALSLSGAAPALAAGDPAAGAAKAVQCQACHGAKGMATMPGAPNLAGQPDIYLVAQLRAFRGGARVAEQMSIVARGLTDQEIEDLAAFYSRIKVGILAE